MVIFLPSFVLPGIHLLWFSTGLFPLQPSGSNAHSAIFGKYTRSFLLPIGMTKAANCCSTVSNSSQKFLPSSAERIGIQPDENPLPSVQSMLNHSVLSF